MWKNICYAVLSKVNISLGFPCIDELIMQNRFKSNMSKESRKLGTTQRSVLSIFMYMCMPVNIPVNNVKRVKVAQRH